MNKSASTVTFNKKDDASANGDRSPIALVVDDEPMVAQFLSQTLGDMGFDVVNANSVALALHAARAKQILTVAFVDLGLPDRSGLELISELQELQPRLPIVIATGYGSMVKNDTAHDSQPPTFLSKPYSIEGVAKALNELGIAAPIPLSL